jgi:hypothetical protein
MCVNGGKKEKRGAGGISSTELYKQVIEIK